MHCREIDQVRATRQPIRGEVPFQGTNGRRIYDYIFVPVLGADGEVEAVAGTTRDVTDRKSMEDELRQLAANLSDADHRKDEFLATLAHELRNPLAPIRNGLQVLKLAQNNAQATEQSRAMMERQVDQMVRLVDDLMDVSRISRGKIALRRERVPLVAVLASAVETSRPLIEQMGHELSIAPPDQPVVVDADLTRLSQVFLNLLNNAAKYSDRAGHIWLSAKRQGSDVVVSVKDSGIGIAAEQLPRIFEMFSQLDRSLERSQGGLGIGLTLVRRLVEMHGGSVEARSEGPGRGSEFIVRLPVVEEAPAVQPAQCLETGMSSLRILIADDNRDSANSLAMLLKIMGHHTRIAYDGQEAVSAAAQFRPDVILMDIGMPKLNGNEACRCIRELPWTRQPIIVAQTGWGQEGDRQQTQAAGFDHHLVKPVEIAALVKVLASLQVSHPET
jgi:signal transduction histidine kinase/CheY-like chemotaxis protein